MRALLVSVLLPLAAAQLVPFDTKRKSGEGGSKLFSDAGDGLGRLSTSLLTLPDAAVNASIAARQLYCPGGQVFCGAANCMPPSATCCGGGQYCAGAGSTCCNPGCASSGRFCCGTGSCRLGDSCCAGRGCADPGFICCRDWQCPQGTTCCAKRGCALPGDKCCPDGDSCSAGHDCCPNSIYCVVSGGTCCPGGVGTCGPGYVCCADGCAPQALGCDYVPPPSRTTSLGGASAAPVGTTSLGGASAAAGGGRRVIGTLDTASPVRPGRPRPSGKDTSVWWDPEGEGVSYEGMWYTGPQVCYSAAGWNSVGCTQGTCIAKVEYAQGFTYGGVGISLVAGTDGSLSLSPATNVSIPLIGTGPDLAGDVCKPSVVFEVSQSWGFLTVGWSATIVNMRRAPAVQRALEDVSTGIIIAGIRYYTKAEFNALSAADLKIGGQKLTLADLSDPMYAAAPTVGSPGAGRQPGSVAAGSARTSGPSLALGAAAAVAWAWWG